MAGFTCTTQALCTRRIEQGSGVGATVTSRPHAAGVKLYWPCSLNRVVLLFENKVLPETLYCQKRREKTLQNNMTAKARSRSTFFIFRVPFSLVLSSDVEKSHHPSYCTAERAPAGRPSEPYRHHGSDDLIRECQHAERQVRTYMM